MLWEEGGGNRRTFNTQFEIKINKYKTKVKDSRPARRRYNKTNKTKVQACPLANFTVVDPPRETRDRWITHVSLIINHATGLAPFSHGPRRLTPAPLNY